MAEGLVKKSTAAVKKEVSYGADPTIASANVIRVQSCEPNPDYDSIEISEIFNSKDEYPSLRGKGFNGGKIAINLRGCNTPGSAPEGDPLYECAVGAKNTSTQSVCGAGSTTTSIVLTGGGGAGFAKKDMVAIICPTATTYTTGAGSSTTSIVVTATPSNLAVGDIIQVPNGDGSALIEATRITAIDSGAKTLTVSPALTGAPNAAQTIKKATICGAWITDISTDTLTVSPAVDAAPDQYTRVRAGVHYKPTTNELPSFWLAFWRGDITREDYGGCKVDTFEMDVSTGGVIIPNFTFKGKSFGSAAGAYSLGAPSFNSLDPMVGVSQILKIGGSTVKASKFNFRITNENQDIEDITSSGFSNRCQVGRKIEGSFDTIYETAAIQSALAADTKAEAILILGRNGLINGQMVGIRIPLLRYVKTPISADRKLWKYAVTWQSQMSLGEDTFMMSFL